MHSSSFALSGLSSTQQEILLVHSGALGGGGYIYIYIYKGVRVMGWGLWGGGYGVGVRGWGLGGGG